MAEEYDYTENDIEIMDSRPESNPEQEEVQTENDTDSNLTEEGEGEEQSEESNNIDESNDTGSSTENEESSQNENSSEEGEGDTEGEFEINNEQLESIINQEFNGMSLDEVKDLINNQQEATPTFESEEEQKLFDFIKSNNSSNFNQSAQEFYRLQGLDVDSMVKEGNFKDLLFEEFKLQNDDVTGDKARRLFDSEFNAKYPSLNKEADDLDTELTEAQELDQIRLERDGKKASSYINDERQATLSSETEQADLQSQQEQERIATEWNQNVDKVMEDFEGFSLSDGDNEFNFAVENQEQISEMMKDSNKFWETLADESGMIQQSKMQEAFAFVTNRDKLVDSLIDHGIQLGKEMLSNEVNNSSQNDRGSQASSNSNSKASNSQQAMEEAILGGQIHNGPRS